MAAIVRFAETKKFYSLCSAEGHLKVLPAVAGAQRAVVESVREKIVHQGTECHAVTPAG